MRKDMKKDMKKLECEILAAAAGSVMNREHMWLFLIALEGLLKLISSVQQLHITTSKNLHITTELWKMNPLKYRLHVDIS